MGKWRTKYYLENGLISTKENYWKNELRSRTKYEYDEFGNVKREIPIYDVNNGQVDDVLSFRLKYKDSLLISKEFSFGMTEKYSDFNELGKPKLIERAERTEFKAFPFKELIEYDDNGNIIESVSFSIYQDLDGKSINIKAIIQYKYNNRNNITEIHREYVPKEEFPIQITGGPSLYKHEYFRYKYNKNGLWTKKYKTVDGKEYLVAKRKYK